MRILFALLTASLLIISEVSADDGCICRGGSVGRDKEALRLSTVQSLLSQEGISSKARSLKGGFLHIVSNATLLGLNETDCPALEDTLRRLNYVEAYCERNYRRKLQLVSNDELVGAQWWIESTKIDQIWDTTTGSNAVIVAILDTGIDHTHPDLASNIWKNEAEIAANNIDDDRNGYIDDVNGYDFGDGDPDTSDNNGHGTHVAGIIGAVGNNKLGTAGTNWNVSLMTLKVFNHSNYTTDSEIIEGVYYAILKGAHILNASLGGPGASKALAAAISDAGDAGMLVVAAAGNGGDDEIGDNNDFFPDYPSSYDFPNIISVGASDLSGYRAKFSNFGIASVDLVAPGTDIISTYTNNQYASISGTSQAAPIVAGVAALFKSINSQFSALQIKDLILNNTDKDPALGALFSSAGRLNALAAFNAAQAHEFQDVIISTDSEVDSTKESKVTVSLNAINKQNKSTLNLDKNGKISLSVKFTNVPAGIVNPTLKFSGTRLKTFRCGLPAIVSYGNETKTIEYKLPQKMLLGAVTKISAEVSRGRVSGKSKSIGILANSKSSNRLVKQKREFESSKVCTAVKLVGVF